MTGFAQALQHFFEGFGLPVYAVDDVPDGAQLPYITYELVAPAPRARARMRAWIWHRAEGGAALNYDGGCAYVMMDGVGEASEVGGEVRGVEGKLGIGN